MFANCAVSCSRPVASTAYSRFWLPSVGGAPIAPAATWTFCACRAVTTSPAESPLSARRFGSTQSRIAYLRSPKTRTSETPLMRLRSLTTLFSRKFVRYA